MPYNENYNTDPAVAFEGMVADQTPATIVSRTVEVAALTFGHCVKQGAADYGCERVETGDTAILGIAVRNQAAKADDSSTNEYPVKDTASILLKGAIWVKAGATVAAGDPVHVTVDGSVFGTGAGAGKVAISGATYETSGAANALVRVRLV